MRNSMNDRKSDRSAYRSFHTVLPELSASQRTRRLAALRAIQIICSQIRRFKSKIPGLFVALRPSIPYS